MEADRIVLRVPWKKPPSRQRREIIVPQSAAPQDARPIRAETRATLVASIARGRRWLDEIVAGTVTVEQIAAREQCSIRQVNMTISLAFLAPRLVQAAVEGRLPRGIGVARLRDAPAEWDRQYAMLRLIGLIPGVATQAGARNGFAEPGDRAPKIAAIATPRSTETARPSFEPRKSPQIGAYSSETGNRRFVQECVVDLRGLKLPARHAVSVEPVSGSEQVAVVVGTSTKAGSLSRGQPERGTRH